MGFRVHRPIISSATSFPSRSLSASSAWRVGFRVSGFGFRISGFRFSISGFGFRVSGFRFFGFRVSGVPGAWGPASPRSTRPAAANRAPGWGTGVDSDLVQYCQLCGKVAEMTLGSDFTHTIVNLSIAQLPVAVRKSTEPDQVDEDRGRECEEPLQSAF